MPLIKKSDFINILLHILDKKLDDNLPDEDFEYQMLEKAKKIIYDYIKHVEGVY